jgi:hypothetical protein
VPAIASKPASEPCRRTTRTNEEWGSSTPTRKEAPCPWDRKQFGSSRQARQVRLV